MKELPDFRRLFRIRRLQRDLEEELRMHFDLTVEDLVKRGHTREEAEREAGRRFGNLTRYRRELQRIDRSAAARRRIGDRVRAGADVAAHALRSLRRSPGLSAAIVVALALGIGANGTMFRIVDRLWFSPPAHIEEPEQIVRVLVERLDAFSGARRTTAAFSHPGYRDLLAARGFAEVAATTVSRLTLGHGEGAERVRAELASGSYFRMLGVRPALGRFFDETDDVAGAEAVAVLSHGFWQRAYGGSEDALGSTLDFGRGPYTIIGVAPRHFTGVELGPVDLWLPLDAAGAALNSEQFFTGRPVYWLAAYARLAPDVSPAAAAAEATALHRAGYADAIEAGSYDPDAAIVPASVIAARGPLARPEVNVAAWLAAVSLLVLVIACVNVASLLLARVVRQRREIAVRLAIGVSRGRLVGQVLLEGLLLGAAGGALALLLAHTAAPALGGMLLPDVDWTAASAAGRLPSVVAALALLAGLLSALPPALQASRRPVADALRAGATGTLTRSTARARGALALTQTTLSVLLLVGAALFLRSVEQVRTADLGWEPRGLLLAFPTFAPGSTTSAERAELFQRATERLEALPRIAAAGATLTSPFGTVLSQRVRVPGRDFTGAPRDGDAYVHAVSPGYFDALQLRVREGRVFSADDREDAPAVAVVNRTLARAGWPDGQAVGGCVHFGDAEADAPCLIVVGVVEDPSPSSFTPVELFQVWLPAAQRPLASARSPAGLVPDRLLVRTREEQATAAVAEDVRRELIALDPRVRFVEVRSMREVMEPITRSWELGATVFSAFGVLALVLSALGLYSVLAFDVAQRTRELGLRSALGATRSRLMRSVIWRGLRLTALGIGVGLLLSYLLAPRLGGLLFEVSPRDGVSYGGAALVLLGVALLASGLPARRATRADPMQALRSD
jgi:predicted permease